MNRSVVVVAVVFAGFVGFAGCPSDVKPTDGTHCDVQTGCADGRVCQNGTCADSCTTSPCVSGQCEEQSGRCVECLSDDNCSDGLVCNDFSHRCTQQAAGCTSNDDCNGLICDPNKGNCVECLSDGDCDSGACDQLTSTCAQTQTCTGDADCSDGVCNLVTGVCVECTAPENCASNVCDTASNTCVAGCVDNDATEPNDGVDAVTLASGGAHEGSICPGDVDEFLVTGDGTLHATLTVDGGAPALTVTALDSAGNTIATGAPSGSGAVLTAAIAGTVRVVVRAASADDAADYLLSVDVDAGASCTQLDSEPNDSTGTATSIAADDALHSGAICGADVDLWKFTAAAGDDVEVAAAPGDGAGTLGVAILDATGAVLTTGNPANLAGVSAGTFFARVTATGGDVTYSVRVRASNAPPVCSQVDAEPNDLDTQALSLQPGTATSGTVCPGDVDQFRFAAAALDDVDVTITGSNTTARLVRASDGATIGSGTTSIHVADLAAGGYRVVIQGANASVQATYTVRVVITPEPVPDPCTEGGIEPDSLASGRALALDGTQSAGRVCANDTDFFTFTLPFASTVTAHARFTHANGDLDISLVDATGAEVGFSDGVTDDEIVVATLNPGTYTVKIFGFLGAVNTYTMEATLQGCTPEDGFEVNNDVTRATPIGTAPVGAARCPGDDDFFLLRLESGDVLDATLAGTGLTFSLVSSTNGALLQSDTASGNNRAIHASGLPPGRYGLRVTGSGADRVAYTLTPSITANPARCIDDGATPNETAAAAFPLDATGLADGSYQVGGLVSCDIVDDDWFSIALPANKLVTVQLAFDPSADIDVELLEPKGTAGLTRSLARSFATNKNDRVSGVINAAGTYFVKTIGFTAAQTAYGIGITVADPPPSSCTNDRYDTWTATSNTATDDTFKNDDVTTTATELSSAETLPNMRICVGDHDFFKMSAQVGQHVKAHVTYVHTSDRDIDIRLYGPADQTNPVTVSVGTTGTEDIDFVATQSGDHFLEVHEFLDDGENFYDLTTSVQ